MIKLDTCGMACPQPVLMTKKALDENPPALDIIVDNMVAKGNVERFLKGTDYKYTIKEDGDSYIIEVRK